MRNQYDRTNLIHDFCLLSQEALEAGNYYDVSASFDKVQLHDDIIQYMLDTLLWIPSLNPAKNERQHGLCLFGLTVLDQQGSALASSTFSTWAQLFSLGPEGLFLKGSYTVIEGSESEGHYSYTSEARDDLVNRLQTIADFAEEVTHSQNIVLLHLGI